MTTTSPTAATATATTTASVVSTLITSLGSGSGVDMTALATNLASAEYASKLDRLSSQSDTIKQQVSDAGNLKSLMTNLSSSIATRVRTGDLSPQPQVGNPSVASGTLSGTSTPSGTYSLEVSSLADNQVLTSPAFASASSTVGAGTLTLRFGAVSASGFTQDASQSGVPVTIAAGSTLSDVAKAINAAGAGVTAYVANGKNGAQLVLKGQQGADNGFVLDASEDAANPGLSSLAWTAGSDPSRLVRSAKDAALTIDGVAITSASNTATDAIPGVTLNLTSTNVGAPTAVSFSNSSDAVSSMMSDLTDALNDIAGTLKTATDPQTGDLARDSGARALKASLSALAGKLIMPNAPPGAPSTLADLGLTLQRDGSFTLDTGKLSKTLSSDPDAVAAMFTNGLYGVFGTVDALARTVTDPSSPTSLAHSITTYTAAQTTNAAQTTKFTDQETTERTRLIARLTAANTSVGSSKSTMSMLQDQIDAWNKSTS
jgi:flagellar hook-associated protein 2